MPDELSPQHLVFEDIKITVNGIERWDARMLMTLVGYNKWQDFLNAVDKAKVAAEQSGQDVENHFLRVSVKNDGKGRPGLNYLLSRTASYLTLQNGDPRMERIAAAQTYFAQQTQKQEVFESLGPDRQRLILREEVTNNNKKLASAAKKHGVTHFPFFNNAGYRGLYGDLNISQIEKRKGVKKGDLLDRAGRTELAANLFRITQTEDVLSKRAEISDPYGQKGAEMVHYTVAKRVRQTIIENKNTLPEELPIEPESIKQIERRIKDEQKAIVPAEKPMKIEDDFDGTMSRVAKAKPPEK